MNKVIASRTLIACGLLLATACVPQQVRTDARLLSLTTQSVQKDAEEFAKASDLVMKARLRNMSFLEDDVMEAEQRMSIDSVLWTLSNPARLKLFQTIVDGTTLASRQRQQTLAKRDANGKAIAAAHSGASVNSSSMAKTAQALASLSEQQDLEIQAKFLVGFFKEVRAISDSLVSEASKQAKSAATAADKKKAAASSASTP